MSQNDVHTGVVPAPLETEVPSAVRKEGTTRGSWLSVIQLLGVVSVLGLLAGCVSGIAPPADPDDVVASTDTLQSNYFQHHHWIAKTTDGTITLYLEVERWMQLQYEGWATKVWLSTSSDDDTWNIDSDPYYTIYMYGPCDTYGEVDDDDATASAIHNADVDGPKLLMDHHSSKIQLANLESKILELTGAASKARRHLEKISDECNNKNVCKVAGQSASALFATSFVLVFANAIVTIMTMNGGIDTKAKISAVLHGLVILLTAIAVGVFTIDCASAVFAEDQEDRENFYGADFEYTSEYTNGATFSCAIAAVVISVVLLVLRLVPLPAQVVMPVKEGEELVGKP